MYNTTNGASNAHINLSLEAANYLRNKLSNLIAFINLKPTGCAGYEFTLSENNIDSKTCHEYTAHSSSNGIKFFFKPSSTPYIDGLIIGLEQSSASKKIIFNSPLETARCGCGKSISF